MLGLGTVLFLYLVRVEEGMDIACFCSICMYIRN
jgi:hypothetical protein